VPSIVATMRPELGFTIPMTHFISVLLPLPLGAEERDGLAGVHGELETVQHLHDP
jgi:hypothetical protein